MKCKEIRRFRWFLRRISVFYKIMVVGMRGIAKILFSSHAVELFKTR